MTNRLHPVALAITGTALLTVLAIWNPPLQALYLWPTLSSAVESRTFSKVRTPYLNETNWNGESESRKKLLVLEGEQVRFPYGRCWGNSNEQCLRPFFWKALNSEELGWMYSDLELSNIQETICPEELRLNSNEGTCCIGAVSHGGGLQWTRNDGCNIGIGAISDHEPRPLGRQQYWAQFNRVFQVADEDGPHTLFELADVLAAVPNASRIHFIGDSVMHQTFDGVLCGAARDARVTIASIREYRRNTKVWSVGTRVRYEVDITLAIGGEKRVYFLVMHREHRFSEDGVTIWEICHGANILIFNFGLHWNNIEDLRRAADILVQAVEDHCTAHGVQVIFRGTTSQHFLTHDGLYKPTLDDEVLLAQGVNKSVLESFRGKKDIGCSPIHWSNPEVNYDWRNSVVLSAFEKAGHSIAITPWGQRETGCADPAQKTLFYIPFGEVTMDRFDLHLGECTHYCSTPSLWSVVTDGIYLAVRQRNLSLCAKPFTRAKLGSQRPDGTTRPQSPRHPKFQTLVGGAFQLAGITKSTTYTTKP